jgi:hypothetical protein
MIEHLLEADIKLNSKGCSFYLGSQYNDTIYR